MDLAPDADAVAVLDLPRHLSTAEGEGLLADILERRGHPMTLDAGRVEHLGALCLQILLSAERSWRRDGVAFAVAPRSPGFEEGLARFGIPVERFAGEEAT
ncbi:MAG: STAS domain-containing protein [Pseudomonadota bacterium]